MEEIQAIETAEVEFKQLTKDMQFDILLQHRQVILAETALREASAAMMKVAENHIRSLGHDLKEVNLDMATVLISPKKKPEGK